MKPEWLDSAAARLDENIRKQALERQGQLTKPPGALGQLEDIAVRLAAMQGKVKPTLDSVRIAVFAGDHGVANSGVSAFPQAVTTEMVKNFANGGAAISVLASALNAELEVVNLGTVFDPGPLDNVRDMRIAPSTKDFSQEAAMTDDQFYQALNAGRQSAERAAMNKAQLFIGGEMGIGNTTSATAIACALLNKDPELIAGPGTGLDNSGVQHKIDLIRKSLKLHEHVGNDALEILRHFGGFEIVALTGSFIACAKMGIPVLVDGFIASAAALCAAHICDNANDWFLFAHTSAEPGHIHILNALGAKPLINLGMRLGEGSGAATALPLLRMACELHNNMATFSEAGVSGKSE